MPHEDDRSLITRIARGDQQALPPLVERHRDAAWRVIRMRVSDDATAEDALQETFLGVWRGAGSLDGDAPVRSWILGIARRQAARTWRRRAGEPDHTEPLADLGKAAGWGGPDPELAASRAEQDHLLHAALDRLPAEDREVLTLRDLEGLSGPEAADALGIGLPALKSRLHRARLRLMAELRDDLGGPDAD